MTEPRELTTEEVRERFLAHVRAMVRYWEKDSREPSVQGKLEGLAFSILVALDGESAAVPGFLVVPDPHPDDKRFRREQGDDWYPENHEIKPQLKGQIAGSLHDLFLAQPKESGKEGA